MSAAVFYHRNEIDNTSVTKYQGDGINAGVRESALSWSNYTMISVVCFTFYYKLKIKMSYRHISEDEYADTDISVTDR